jgi:glycosyltransferase involved in cell wall biosynthesis
VEQTYKNFEVVIVDGGSTDHTNDIVDEFSKKIPIVFATQSGGLIPQANKGWQIATGDIVTRTDDDVILTPDWLKEIAQTFANDETIGGVTGPTIIPEERLKGRDLTYFNQKMKDNPNVFWKLFSKLYYGFFMEGQPFAVSKFFRCGAFSLGSNYKDCLNLKGLIPADHLEACNSSIRRSLIERAGGYDPQYVGIGEYHEPDLAYKVKALGYKLVFNPKAILYHCPSVSGVFKARPQAYGRSQNFILFYFRHIKPNTINKFFRFSSYLTFINLYWLFKFFTSFDINQLYGITGTFVGLIKYLPELPQRNV